MSQDPGLKLLAEGPARATRVRRADEVTSLVGPRSFLHAGPALAPGEETVGPMRGALLGALVFEGSAADLADAARILDSGELKLSPCHAAGGVGAMAGVVSPSMQVLVTEGAGDRTAFAPLNEGLGEALRFGSTQEHVISRLRWMRDTVGPTLDAALLTVEGVDVVEMQAEGLRRGDECHNRNVASTAALIARLAPTIVRVSPDSETAAEILTFLSGNPHTFLTFSMAAAKVIADAAHDVAAPGLVTALCANGHRMGMRVSGLSEWVTTESPLGRPKLFPGFTREDACPAMGDSFITEVIGLGAFALTAAPAISSFIGGSHAESVELVESFREVTRTTSKRFLVPSQGFSGTPVGIDVGKVVATGVLPYLNNGFAHREAGRGQVGAGITQAPKGLFLKAAAALAKAEVQPEPIGSAP